MAKFAMEWWYDERLALEWFWEVSFQGLELRNWNFFAENMVIGIFDKSLEKFCFLSPMDGEILDNQIDSMRFKFSE